MATQQTMDVLQERVHGLVSRSVDAAVRKLPDLQGPEADKVVKRLVRYLSRAVSDPELLSMPAGKLCDELVSRAMKGFTAACQEEPWFFDVDLVPPLKHMAREALIASGQGHFPPNVITEVIQLEYQDKLDRILHDRGLWEAVSVVFKDHDKLQSKIFKALQNTCWQTLEDVLDDPLLEEDVLVGQLSEEAELQRTEVFVRKWLDNGMSRAWMAIESNMGVLSEETLETLIKQLLAPFPEDHPFGFMSCIPDVLTGRLGRPPSDWAYIGEVVAELFRTWNQEPGEAPAAKRRKKGPAGPANGYGGGGAAAAGRSAVHSAVWRPTPGARAAKGGGKAKGGPSKSSPAEQDPEVGEEAGEDGAEGEEGTHGPGHPKCTSAEDCVGSPDAALVRHMLNGQAGDAYCEPCWASFRARNPSLEGIREE